MDLRTENFYEPAPSTEIDEIEFEEDDDQMVGGANHDFEKEFYEIYEKARQYKKRLQNIKEQSGGAEGKKKRKASETIKLFQELAKKLRSSGKHSDIPWKDYLKISKYIITDAKEETGMEKVNETVRIKALELSDNPDIYYQRYYKEKKAEKDKTEEKAWAADSNYRKNAQSDLWNDSLDTDSWDNTSYRGSDLTRYGGERMRFY